MFTPVLNIGQHWAEPSHEGFQLDLLGEPMLRAAKVAPGILDGLALHPLSKETLYVDDPLVGQIPFRPREISPIYKPFWLEAGIRGKRKWMLLPSESESAQREVSRRGIEAQLAILLQKAGISRLAFTGLLAQLRPLRSQDTDEANARADKLRAQVLAKLSPDEQKRAEGYGELLDQLGEDGTSFLEEVPNLFASGVTGIRWNLAVPNIDVALASSWTCEADQKQSFRIQRLSTLPGQLRSEFEIRIGNGKTLYALAFTKDESVQFRHYRNTGPRYSLQDRAGDEKTWLEVLATGYLSSLELAQIAEWSAERAKTKNKVKKEDLRERIAKLRASKSGLTDAAKTRADALEARLFIKRENIMLQEEARSLFDREFDVTLGFHRKGYISIRIGLGGGPGAEPYYYQVESIQKTGRPGNILPDGSRILLKSNGGVWGVGYGLTNAPEKSRLYFQPFSIPFPFVESEWNLTLDAIGQNPATADPSQPLTILPRARIEARIEQVSGAQTFEPHTGTAKLRVCLDFYCDPDPLTGARDYGSELYRATATCKAGDLPPLVFDTWRAAAHGFPTENVGIQSDATRGAFYDLQIIDTQNREAGLPVDLAERAVEFGLIDNRPGASFGQFIPLLRGGTIAEPISHDVRRFRDSSGKLRLFPRLDTRRTLSLKSVESLLDVPVKVPLIGNDEWPGDYLRELFNVHGAPVELLARLPQGRAAHVDLGLSKLPAVELGSYPDIKPAFGASLWNYAQEIVGKHCAGFRLRRESATGVLLQKDAFRPTDFAYSTALPERDLMSVQRPLRVWQNVSEYFTDATFTGAYNPGAGRRYAGREIIHEATKPGSAFHIGRHRTHSELADPSLRSDVKCLLAVRQFLRVFGRPPWFASWLTWYEPELREGDILTLDSIRFVVEKTDVINFTKAKAQKMTISARLLDDVPIWEIF